MPSRFKGMGERPWERRKFEGRAGDRRQLRKCFKCQKFGHIAADCRSAATGNRAPTSCTRCGGRNHAANDCRTKQENIGKKCSFCQRTGHTVEVCRAKNTNYKKSSVSCFNCGKAGHKASQCRSAKPEHTKTSSNRKCYNCGEIGHVKKNCKGKKIEDAHKGQWPQTRRIPRAVTFLPKKDGVNWMREEISHAVELVRILEIMIDSKVASEKLSGRIARARPKPKTIEVWYRSSGVRKKVDLDVGHTGSIIDQTKLIAIREDFNISLELLKKEQENLFSCVLENSFRCSWNVKYTDSDSSYVKEMVEKARSVYEKDGGMQVKLETTVNWVNQLLSTAHQILDEAIRDVTSKNAELLAKQHAEEATSQVLQQASQDVGTQQDSRRNEQERKRLRDEHFNSAMRAVNNPFGQTH